MESSLIKELNYTALIILVLFVSKHCDGISFEHVKTGYNVKVNGTILTCFMCQAGEHFVSDCTLNNTAAVCRPCIDGVNYSTKENRFTKCQHCSTGCPDNTAQEQRQSISKPCTRFSDRQCTCIDGLFKPSGSSDTCQPWRKCPSGEGVATLGNATHDTQCMTCDEGYFSSTSSHNETCQKCRVCPSGTNALDSCNRDADTVCVNSGMSAGEIAGTIVGCFALICIGVAISIVCIKRRKTWEDDEKHIGSNNNRLGKEEEKSDQLTEGGNLVKLAHSLCRPGWELLFLSLFEKDAQRHIDAVKVNAEKYQPCKVTIYQVLKKWIEVDGANATKSKLYECLKEGEFGDVLEEHSVYPCS